MDLGRHRFALQFPDRLIEQAHIGVEAHRVDVAVLLSAQQVSGAAQLEIERRDLEARAQIAELL